MNESLLVSVVLISYNAEDYIIEALESVKNQTYKNIELVISDDASTDNTASYIENWLVENAKCFNECKFLKNEINLGITKNLNKAVKSAKGAYMKLLASDDILYKEAIANLLKFCLDNNLEYCFSNVLPFDDENSERVKKIAQVDAVNSKRFFEKNHKNQYRALLNLNTPLTFTLGAFYKSQVIEAIGYYDEKYPMQEDYSFALKLSKLGKKFEKLDTYTYKYRVRVNLDKDYKKSKRYIQGYECMAKIRKDFILYELLNEKMYFSYLYLRVTMIILDLEFHENSKMIIRIAKFGRWLKQSIMNVAK